MLDVLVRQAGRQAGPLAWLQRVPTRLLSSIALDTTEDHFDLETNPELSFLNGSSSHIAVLYALRGLLGYGLLVHALSYRHRVHFGVDDSRAKRIAVPFVAADVPSERSEFVHPDITLILTSLAYYYDGLRRDHVLETFLHLVGMAESVQDQQYQRWLQVSIDGAARGQKELTRKVSDLDLANTQVGDLL
jgi:hypothetical protein